MKINGNDLSSLNKILNFGLNFFIRFASKSRASLSFEVVVISNFLETLAEDVFYELFKDKRIDKISLRIEKLEIMKDCSSVGIQISKKRSYGQL